MEELVSSLENCRLFFKLADTIPPACYTPFMRKNLLAEHYVPRIDSQKKGYEILDWESEAAHIGRFSILRDQVDLKGMTLLDVGCGVGDLYHFLQKERMEVNYTGIDILPDMIQEAERRYPEGKFLAGDLFSQELELECRYDVVYSSGIFNLNLGNNRTFLQSALPVFFAHAEKYVIFNLLDPGHPVQSNRYAYFEPEEVISWVRPFSHTQCIVRDYVPHDFTIIAEVLHSGN